MAESTYLNLKRAISVLEGIPAVFVDGLEQNVQVKIKLTEISCCYRKNYVWVPNNLMLTR